MLVYHFEGVPRNPLTVALKNVLTLGIHTKLWLYRVNREMDGHEGFHINLPGLAVLVALPIVTPAIVKFQTAARLNSMVSHHVTLPIIRARRLGWISLIPILGSGFYAYWVQGALNRHWFWHRREERMRLLKERIAEITQDRETEETLERRVRLEEEHRALEREIEEEIEAARIRWGEERFNERKERADLHAKRGRLSRKELATLRAQAKAKRKAERMARRRARNPLAGLKPRRADPEDDAAWEPETPLPERTPEEIRAVAEAEGREPTKAEAKELKTAERLLARREKESTRLEKRRDKLRARLAKEREREEKKRLAAAAKQERVAEKTRETEAKKQAKRTGNEEARAAKRRKKEHRQDPEEARSLEPGASEADGASKRERKRAAKAERRAAREEAKARKRERKEPQTAESVPPKEEKKARPGFRLKSRKADGPPTAPPAETTEASAGESGAGLRVMKVRCPRCRTALEVRKHGDAPAKLSCTSCGLVGKV